MAKSLFTSVRKISPFTVIFFLIAVLSISLNIYFIHRIGQENMVSEVVDGDTFQLVSGKRIRLMGVDAPEIDRCGGREAKAFLDSLISGKKVSLKEEVQESYGRTLALVYQRQVLVNEKVLEEGLARPDYRKNSQRDRLTSAYHQAQTAKKGIFSGICRQENPESGCLIKGNIDYATSKKFYHLPDCFHYGQIAIDKDRGERYFCTEDEALGAGFVKASGCPKNL